MLGRSVNECQRHVSMVLHLLQKLGFIINRGKCNLEPSSCFTYLGVAWNTQEWKVSLKTQREVALRASAAKVLAHGLAGVREVARFLGRVNSTTGIVPLARLRSRAVAHDFSVVCKSPEDYNSFFILSEEARKQLEYWMNLPAGLSLPITNVDLKIDTVDTDASETGYGWYYHHSIFSGNIPEPWLGAHINLLNCGVSASSCKQMEQTCRTLFSAGEGTTTPLLRQCATKEATDPGS